MPSRYHSFQRCVATQGWPLIYDLETGFTANASNVIPKFKLQVTNLKLKEALHCMPPFHRHDCYLFFINKLVWCHELPESYNALISLRPCYHIGLTFFQPSYTIRN